MFIDGLRAGLQIQIFINNDEKLPDIGPISAKIVRAEWKVCTLKRSAKMTATHRLFMQTTRIAAGVDAEPETEWLNL